MTELDNPSAYEKGVIARALLDYMIKQGRLEDSWDDDEDEFEIRLPVRRWHLELLATVSEDVQAARRERRNLSEKLSKMR